MVREISRFLVIPLASAALLHAQQDPAVLQLKLVEGAAAVYPIGSRATRGITVQISDESGRPVDGAIVSFRLPDDGPSGSFANGSKTEIATTKADGRASAWGMLWNRTPGALGVRITAAKGATRAGIVCSQYLTDAPEAAISKNRGAPGSRKWLWIAAGVAGAAGVAIAAVAGGKSSTTPSTPAGLTIGSPVIILGHP